MNAEWEQKFIRFHTYGVQWAQLEIITTIRMRSKAKVEKIQREKNSQRSTAGWND